MGRDEPDLLAIHFLTVFAGCLSHSAGKKKKKSSGSNIGRAACGGGGGSCL